jgi:Amt family ammonium transporter
MNKGSKMRVLVFFVICAAMGALLMGPPLAHKAQSQEAASAPTVKGDPNGSQTGTINDVPAKVSGKPTLEELGNEVGHHHVAINMTWTLLTGYLVMFMAAGFLLVALGFTRSKNSGHTAAMVFMVYAAGTVGYWMTGFAFQFGGLGPISTMGSTGVLNHELTIKLFGKPFGLIGGSGFFLSGMTYDVAVFALFLFQKVFMDTANYIPTGAMAERWKFLAFFIYSFVMSMFIYPLFGNWVWGGGWLSQLGANFGLGHGHVDFAGSSVVHMVGGVTALAGAIVLGPRIGKYNKDGKPNPIPGHNIPLAMLGTLILAYGWFGFNPGSTLAGTDLRISVVATNTMLASATGAVAAALWMWIKFRKPDPSMMVNGMLAGLVAITAPCAFVNSVSAAIIGTVAGVLVIESCFFFERIGVDDPAGAISVHGTNGAWGVLSLGLFADGTYGDGWNGVQGTVKGLFYGAPSQFIAEVIGTITCFVVVFALAYATFKIIGVLVGGMRVSPEAELDGLDVPEMGAQGYAGDLAHQPAFSALGYGYPLIPMSKEKADAVGKAFLGAGKEKS